MNQSSEPESTEIKKPKLELIEAISDKRVYPTDLKSKEEDQVKSRRTAAGLENSTPAVGVALSGGGIRSATFCLGFFQALAGKKRLREVDFLSTVSGGGYFGGFLGRFFTRDWVSEKATTEKKKPVDVVEEALAPHQAGGHFGSPVSDWLRENGRYISPNGAGDTWLALAVYLRNLGAVHYLLGMFVLMSFCALHAVRSFCWHRFPLWESMEKFLLQHTWDGRWWWNPWIFVPLWLIVLLGAPLSWSYWLTQLRSKQGKLSGGMSVGSHVAMSALLFYFYKEMKLPGLLVAAVLPLVSLAAFLLAHLGSKRDPNFKDNDAEHAVEQLVRHRLSTWLRNVLAASMAMLVAAIIGSLGQTVHGWLRAEQSIPATLSTIFAGSVVLSLVRKFAPTIAEQLFPKARGRTSVMFMFTTVLGVLVGVLVLVFWSVLGHALLWGNIEPPFPPAPAPPAPSLVFGFLHLDLTQVVEGMRSVAKPHPWLAAAAFGIGFVLSLMAGKANGFLNLSSLQQLYGSRLTRAYLGATNPARLPKEYTGVQRAQNSSGGNVTEVVPGDNITFWDYEPENTGGPLHIINMTLNETVSGFSQLEQRDRKGLQFAVGSAGMSVGRWDHALWHDQHKTIQALGFKDRYHMLCEADGKPTEPEMLSLGNWIAISGAAFTTGLGARTNLGLSILLGSANVRLGYWWNSHVDPAKRQERAPQPFYSRLSAFGAKTFSTQAALLGELLARFHGPNRKLWYLSDGGHFENTALYELIRRRVPIMLCCDNGADETYTFEDIANITRKARLDFNAEITFLDETEIQEVLPTMSSKIGTLKQLSRAADGISKTHAALAKVCYDGKATPESVILFIKPSLTGKEPLDISQYHSQNPTFPQQSTMDQFFDEAQWESYRRLGQHIGEDLFANFTFQDLAPAKLWPPSLV